MMKVNEAIFFFFFEKCEMYNFIKIRTLILLLTYFICKVVVVIFTVILGFYGNKGIKLNMILHRKG